MGFHDRRGYENAYLGSSVTTTGANESIRIGPANGLLAALLQTQRLTDRYSLNETWRPVGFSYIVTTTLTVTAPVLTLQKNGVAAASGGTATVPISAAASTVELFAQFSAYTFAAADLAADVWSVKVSTTSTAGVITVQRLWYALIQVPAIAEGVTQ